MTSDIRVEALSSPPAALREVEIVECKGLGHPDTICDRVAEAVSRALCRVYLETAGGVLHHNIDKALLVAGSSEPRLGGGQVTAPMRLLLGDRATDLHDGRTIPVHEIATATARTWVRDHLRYVDPDRHLRVESVLRPGSSPLVDLVARDVPGANDTSVGVGYAPLSETERIVLQCERTLTSARLQREFPVVGEDVKVMGVRRGRRLELTVAVAFVDRFVPDERAYFEHKVELRDSLLADLRGELVAIEELDLTLNALDREGAGPDGLYLTVLGTSAEGADSGQVGRGNRVTGLIPFQRPFSMEAAAGKNPVSHVGKIYNLLAQEAAVRIQREVEGLEEVRVFLCSRIGDPLDRPWLASLEVGLADGADLTSVSERARSVLAEELAATPAFLERLVREGMAVC